MGSPIQHRVTFHCRQAQIAKFRRTNQKSFHIQTKHLQDGDVIPQLFDSGCDIELMSWKFLKERKWNFYRLQRPTILEYMDGRQSDELWYATRQTFKLGPAGDRRIMTVQYRLCNIGENLVLGDNWWLQVNPNIDRANNTWTWRDPVSPDIVEVRRATEAFVAMKARKRIIQGEIQSNEAPEWARRRFGELMKARAPGEMPPRRPGIDYQFEMKDDWLPRREKPRRFSPVEREMFRELARKETNDYAPGGWRWDLSNGPQASQMLWAAKAGEKKRPCTDYRRLNTYMKDDSGPLPSIEAMIQDMAGKKFLTSMDIPKAYHEIRIAEGGFTCKDGTYVTYEEALGFQCGDDLFQPKVLQFGSKTAVAHFQRFIHNTLRKHWGRGVYAYLDNVIIGADTIQELEALEYDVLLAFEAENLRIELTKCEWHKTQVLFCGFLIGGGRVVLDPAKLEAVRQWTLPWDDDIPEGEKRTAIREFIGFCLFYRESIDRFSLIAAPLTSLMGPKYPWRVTDVERRAFDALKRAVCEAVERVAFDEKAPKMVMADASQIGAISSGVHQRNAQGKWEPLGFFSRKLSDTEMRYTVTELELMAIVETFQNYGTWMHASPHEVKVYSDHSALKNLRTTPLDPKRARWVIGLEEYRFVIEHIPGRENRVADALSRVGTHGKKVGSWKFEHPEWFAPSGVSANELLGMSHSELWRRYGEPLIGRDKRMMEAWEKHKKEGTASSLKDLVSLLILSSNIS